MASRYFATVRRAMSTPSVFKRSTIMSSDRMEFGTSPSISCLIRCRTASDEWASPSPSAAAIDDVKKYLSSRMPRGVAMYLFEVTRETVDSCIEIASATVFKFIGRRYWTPCVKNASCCRTISSATRKIVRARWSRALNKPVCRLQTFEQVALVLIVTCRLRDFSVVDAIDENARKCIGVQFDEPTAIVTSPHDDVGHHRLHLHATELEPRLRIELLDLGNHLAQLVGVNADRPSQADQIVCGDEPEIFQQSRDLRIVAVLVLELQRQTFGKRSSTHAGRFKAL